MKQLFLVIQIILSGVEPYSQVQGNEIVCRYVAKNAVYSGSVEKMRVPPKSSIVEESNITVNTDHRLIGGFFETKYDIKNKNLLWDADQTLTGGGGGVGDIRTGEERAQFVVDYTINPDIKVKPVVTDGSRDEIKEGENYVFTRNENGKYQLVFTDDQGGEHTVETERFPVTIQDKDGNVYEITQDADENVRMEYKGNIAQEELGDAGDDNTTPVCGCPNDMFQSVLNGDCQHIMKLLQAVKTAYADKKQLTLNKLSLLEGRISIDTLCIPKLYFDMSWVQSDTVRFDPSAYKVTKSSANAIFGGNAKFWAIKYDNILEIKISESENDAERRQ